LPVNFDLSHRQRSASFVHSTFIFYHPSFTFTFDRSTFAVAVDDSTFTSELAGRGRPGEAWTGADVVAV
jgi:hypothetical protein